VEKQQIPDEWLKTWAAQEKASVEQRPFPPKKGGSWPLDGDVYSVSPKNFQLLKKKMELAPFQEGELWKGINPAFGGQSFDIDNQWTRPWRWTPYFFCGRVLNESSNGKLPEQWWKEENSLWPDDINLLAAVRMKEKGMSANNRGEAWKNKKEKLKDELKFASEDECWEAVKAGKISFLPAYYRIREDVKGVRWHLPEREGTMIQFEMLVISSKSIRGSWAKNLVAYLLSNEKQKEMVKATGYFPVISKEGKEWKDSPIDLPKGKWFERGEYLLAKEKK
jgi:spermidine/putrescine-binding protein